MTIGRPVSSFTAHKMSNPSSPKPVSYTHLLSLTLKEMGVKIGIAKHRIYTSDRRFPKKTIPKLKVMWKMNLSLIHICEQIPEGAADGVYEGVTYDEAIYTINTEIGRAHV